MADPQADPQAPPAPEGRTLDDRMSAVETEQREQRGILNRIEGLLTGPKSSSGPDSPQSATETDSSGLSVAEQVKRGVAEIEAKRKKDEAAKAKADEADAWKKSVEEKLAERKPAEPKTGRKAKLQERLFGKADAR